MHTLKEYIKTRLKLLLGRGVRRSYGQFGEDALVQSLVKHIKNGVYVDVGAYHPTLYSNTYALYRLGWKGVAVDPNAQMGILFSLVRPRDTFVCAAIGAGGVGTYYSFSDGAYNTFDAAEAEVRKGLRWLKFLGQREVPLRALADICHEQKISKIDFMNVGVEGRDVEALQSHDWSVPPTVIAVEAEGFDAASPTTTPVYNLLASKGYKLVGLCGLTLVFRLGK